jgi:cysteine desulfurase
MGALWVRTGTLIQPLVEGGDQERGLRPGTENVAGAAGFGLAAELAAKGRAGKAAYMASLKEKLYEGLQETGIAVELNGPPLPEAAPHIVNLSFPGVKAEVLLRALEKHGIYTSPGSACHSRRSDPSHVLQALGLEPELLAGSLRFSFSPFNTAEEVETAVRHTAAAVRELSAVAT